MQRCRWVGGGMAGWVQRAAGHESRVGACAVGRLPLVPALHTRPLHASPFASACTDQVRSTPEKLGCLPDAQVTGAVGWRKEGIRYKKNEVGAGWLV